MRGQVTRQKSPHPKQPDIQVTAHTAHDTHAFTHPAGWRQTWNDDIIGFRETGASLNYLRPEDKQNKQLKGVLF